jgi:hypothetical protein
MWLGAETGLRWGECAGVTVGDLDLSASTLKVALQLDRDQRLSPISCINDMAITVSYWHEPSPIVTST